MLTKSNPKSRSVVVLRPAEAAARADDVCARSGPQAD